MNPINMTNEQIREIRQQTHKAMSDLANTTEGNFDQADMDTLAEDGDRYLVEKAQRALLDEVAKHLLDYEGDYYLLPIKFWQELRQQLGGR